MRFIRHVGVLVGLLTSAFLALSGCGGESTRHGGNTGASGGTGGSGATGATGATGAIGATGATGATGAVGGTISTGGGAIGSGGTGGSTSAGTGGVGKGGDAGTIASGGLAGTGVSGAGGMTSVELCSLPPEPGPCNAAFSRFYFDAVRGSCEPFTYGGCQGNENNFETLDACYAACGLPVGETMRCEISADCTVVPTVCCSCETLSQSELLAIRRDSADEFFASGCGRNTIDCGCDAAVPAWVGATCIQGRCIAVDIRETEYTECAVETDCVLRRGLGCCENCASDGSDLVAVRKDRDIGELTCGALVDCEACATELRGAYASCDEGRCTTNILLR